jgi:hypothetical protein
MRRLNVLIAAAALGTPCAFASDTSVLPNPNQGTWASTLIPRDLDGKPDTVEAFYDTARNVTWLADANPVGFVRWNDAMAWANALAFPGATAWRLPRMFDAGNDGCFPNDCDYLPSPRSSELAHLYYITLGNAGWPAPGYSFEPHPGPFKHLQVAGYWTETQLAPTPSFSWFFDMRYGYNYWAGGANGGNPAYVLALHDGMVGVPVPEPAAAWMLLAGATALMLRARRRRTARGR